MFKLYDLLLINFFIASKSITLHVITQIISSKKEDLTKKKILLKKISYYLREYLIISFSGILPKSLVFSIQSFSFFLNVFTNDL